MDTFEGDKNISQPELTPQQLLEEAQRLERIGDKIGAATEYEKAGYPWLAIKIFEESGDLERAYDIAKGSGDYITANRLVDQYGLAGHELTDYPPARGRDFNEVMSVALESRLEDGATTQNLGFSGFKDKVVMDVGTRDGRFVPLFRSLGAKEVFGLDPDSEALKEAVDKGVLDKEHVLAMRLEDLPETMRGKFEVAAIFNFNIPILERRQFFQDLYEDLPDNAQVVITVAEDEVLQNVLEIARTYFIVRAAKLWGGKDNYPHKNLIICTKRKTGPAAKR